MFEEWKKIIIKNEETGWEVSNLGRFKRQDESITTGFDRGRYNGIEINGKTYSAHRIVAEVFIPNPKNLPQVDHINTNKRDNRVENLRWCTGSENMNNPLTKDIMTKEKHPNAKRIKCIESGIIFNYIREAATYYNISYKHISSAAKGKRKSAGGFHWEYVAKET